MQTKYSNLGWLLGRYVGIINLNDRDLNELSIGLYLNLPKQKIWYLAYEYYHHYYMYNMLSCSIHRSSWFGLFFFWPFWVFIRPVWANISTIFVLHAGYRKISSCKHGPARAHPSFLHYMG